MVVVSPEFNLPVRALEREQQRRDTSIDVKNAQRYVNQYVKLPPTQNVFQKLVTRIHYGSLIPD